MITLLGKNAWLLAMGVAIFMVERFQKNKRCIKNAKTRPAKINLTFTISRFVSLSLVLEPRSGPCPEGLRFASLDDDFVFSWTSVEVLLILFEGRPIFDEPSFVCEIFHSLSLHTILLISAAQIRPGEPSLWFCAWRVLKFNFWIIFLWILHWSIDLG